MWLLRAGPASAADAAPSAAPPAAGRPSAAILAPGEALAPRLAWDPAWPRFRTAEYVATGALLLATIPALAFPPSKSPWVAPVSLDESARDALRIGGDRGRDTARDASDVLLTVALNYPLLVDAGVVAGWYRDSQDVAWEMVLIDAEAFALNAAASAWVSSLASRQRPYARLCPTETAKQNFDCAGSKRYRSFFSGHTSTAFTSAGLVCSHHASLPLYGGGAPDVLACATSLTAAASMGALRVMADQHYLTDVLAGAAMGTLAGFGVPWALHYRFHPEGARTDAQGLTIGFLPAPQGGYLVGAF